MLYSNKKITPSSTIPLGTDADENPFKEPGEYDYVVGMLMHLYRNSRPVILFSVQQCARFTHNPRKSHSESLKGVFLSLIGTQGQGLTFDLNNDMNLYCYVGEYLSGLWKHKDDLYHVCVKSRIGYVMYLGGRPLNCVSKIQTEIALSTLEA